MTVRADPWRRLRQGSTDLSAAWIAATRRGFLPRVTTIFALLAWFVAVTPSAPSARATERATMSAADIRALQQRLRDAHCYAGPVDGAPIGRPTRRSSAAR